MTEPLPTAENDAACQSLSNVVPFGSDGRLRCLLFSPHDGYRHYAAMPDDWRRFWFWDDGDSVIPPGKRREVRL